MLRLSRNATCTGNLKTSDSIAEWKCIASKVFRLLGCFSSYLMPRLRETMDHLRAMASLLYAFHLGLLVSWGHLKQPCRHCDSDLSCSRADCVSSSTFLSVAFQGYIEPHPLLKCC